jgi:hypothetical protein
VNTEVLAGDQLTLRGRFFDTGYLDTHTATWSIDGTPGATVEEEHDPLLSTGLVSGSITPTANLTGTLTVNDEDGGSGSDPFNVTVVPDTAASLNRHEPNGAVENPNDLAYPPPILESDNAIVSFIQQDGDVDVYEVRMPGGGQVESGSEMPVSLTNLHADADVAILSKLPAEATTGYSRWGYSRWGTLRWGLRRIRLQRVGLLKVGLLKVGLLARWGDTSRLSKHLTTPALLVRHCFQRIGRLGRWFQAPGNSVEGIDVVSLSWGSARRAAATYRSQTFSQSRADDETAWARAATPGAKFYVAVFTSGRRAKLHTLHPVCRNHRSSGDRT